MHKSDVGSGSDVLLERKLHGQARQNGYCSCFGRTTNKIIINETDHNKNYST